MSITLLQKDSFEFDPKAKRNTFNISGKIGIDCILETLKRKIENSDKIENHIWFVKGRTGSGKSSTFFIPNLVNHHVCLQEFLNIWIKHLKILLLM